MNPLDLILVEFTTEYGYPFTVPASQIANLVSWKSEATVSLAVKPVAGTTLVLFEKRAMQLSGTYAENVAIWRKALEPVAKWALNPRIVITTGRCVNCEREFFPGEVVRLNKDGRVCSECSR